MSEEIEKVRKNTARGSRAQIIFVDKDIKNLISQLGLSLKYTRLDIKIKYAKRRRTTIYRSQLPTIWETTEEDMGRKQKGEKEKEKNNREEIELSDLRNPNTITEEKEDDKEDDPAVLDVKTECKTTNPEGACKNPEGGAMCQKKRKIQLHNVYLSYFQGQQPDPEARRFITSVQETEDRQPVSKYRCIGVSKYRCVVGILLGVFVLWTLTVGFLIANLGNVPGPCNCNYTTNISHDGIINKNLDDRITIDLDLDFKDDREDQDYNYSDELETGIVIRFPRREETLEPETDQDANEDQKERTAVIASTTEDTLYRLWAQSQSQNKKTG